MVVVGAITEGGAVVLVDEGNDSKDADNVAVLDKEDESCDEEELKLALALALALELALALTLVLELEGEEAADEYEETTAGIRIAAITFALDTNPLFASLR